MFATAGALLLGTAVLLAPTPTAKTITPGWNERTQLTDGSGSIRVTIDRIVLTKRTWRVTAGVTNRSRHTLRITSGTHRAASLCYTEQPYAYNVGPSLVWQERVPGTNPCWVRQDHYTQTFARGATRVEPTYPRALRPGQSWHGFFSGPLVGVPRAQLVRIGLGVVTTATGRDFLLSTTHQFVARR